MKTTKKTTKAKTKTNKINKTDKKQKKVITDDLNEKATKFYNTYLESGEEKIKNMKEATQRVKDGLAPFGGEANRKADELLELMDKFEKQSKITFKHCEKFVKNKKPVSPDVLDKATQCTENLANAYSEAMELVVKMQKTAMKAIPEAVNKMKEFFLENIRNMKEEVSTQINENMDKLNEEQKKDACKLIDSIDNIYEHMSKPITDKSYMDNLNIKLANLKDKITKFEKNVINKT